jgi:trans-aconitate methyltransferase
MTLSPPGVRYHRDVPGNDQPKPDVQGAGSKSSRSEDGIEWDARTYHRVSQPQVGWGERVLDRLVLSGDETVLDAGCGTGRLTAELLERLPRGQVIALDRSQNMLEAAQAHLLPRFAGRVSFLRSDLAELALHGVADVVFSTATLHWVRDHPRLFRALYRALKPGGYLLAQCGGGPNLAHVLEGASDIMAIAPFAQYFGGWSGAWLFADPETTAIRLREAGFIDIETGLEAAPVVLSSAEEYRSFLATAVFRLHLERLPEDLRNSFLDRLVNVGSQDDPPFGLDYWRLNLTGRRPPE